jgi:twitching motility protein PilT
MEIKSLLNLMVDAGASDLHLKVPCPPVLRINGSLVPQENMQSLRPNDISTFFDQLTTPEQRAIFEKDHELDFAYSINGLARFRINVLKQRGTLGMAIRMVPFRVASVDELDLPQICKEIIQKPCGLILVTGPTGSGKSTTLAAMINFLNLSTRRTVITIEDPIEFLYADQLCVIAQRDLGDDTRSYAQALKHALRHDPDVLVIGEMRDLETISIAITAAETGHLVLGTLHTINAAQTVERIIDAFPHDQQRQIRMQLAQILEAILSQRLVQRTCGGRIAAVEVLLVNPAIRSLILEQKTSEITNNIEMSSREGMQTLDQALAQLVSKGTIRLEDARSKCSNLTKLNKNLQSCKEGALAGNP